MNIIDIDEIYDFVQDHINDFHDSRLKSLSCTKLKELLRKKNPYLFRAKHIITAEELVRSLLDAKISSSEEEIFGRFLEELAIFAAEKALNASKSSSPGIDFEYIKDKTRYLVSVKSGLNWGNSSQWKALEDNFKNAIRILKQSSRVVNIECVLGICYGRSKTTIRKGLILQVCGQSFWYMITGNESFYTDIIEPLGYKAKEKNESFNIRKAEIINRFTKEFIDEFCDESGKILWEKIVEFNSKNLNESEIERFAKED